MAKKLSQFSEITTAGDLDLIVGHSPSAGKNIVIKKENLLKGVNIAQNGIQPYETKADMDAVTPGSSDPQIAYVMNDATASNNGYYRWDTGTTSWVKRDEFYATILDPADTSEAVTGKAVAGYAKKPVLQSDPLELIEDGILSKYDGQTSETQLGTTYVLDSAGDYVEFEYRLYDFANDNALGVIGQDGSITSTSTIGWLTSGDFGVRDNTGSWINSSFETHEQVDNKIHTLKLEWISGDIEVYKNGTLKGTLGGTGAVTIDIVGGAYDNAICDVKNIEISDGGVITNIGSPGLLTSATQTDVTFDIVEGYLSSNQRSIIDNSENDHDKLTDINAVGKNLVDKADIVAGENASRTSTNNWRRTGEIPIQPNTQYTISGYQGISTSADVVVFYHEDDSANGSATAVSGGEPVTFTTPSDVSYLLANVVNETDAGLQTTHEADDTIQIEKGASKTFYEPYRGNYVPEQRNVDYADCFYELDINGSDTGSLEKFTVYCKVNESLNYYAGFEIHHEKDLTQDLYIDIFRIKTGELYRYKNGTMTTTGLGVLEDGDSECVYRLSGASDFSGGVHGDESRIWTRFYIDGVALTDLSSDIPLTPCSKFRYVQKSNTHDPDDATPQIDTERIKDVLFTTNGIELYNKWIWQRSATVSVWYSGMATMDKEFASEGYIDKTYEKASFTGSTSNFFEEVGAREVYYNKPKNELSAFVTSEILQPSSEDANADVFVWDRADDSKYYRRSQNLSPANGEVWEATHEIKFYKNPNRNVELYS